MRKIILTITLAGLSILMFISCRDKCDSDYLGQVAFTEEDLKIVPYHGTETLVFTDSLGNTMSFTGNERYSNFDSRYTQYTSASGDPDFCVGDYFDSEDNFCTFNGADVYSFIWISLFMDRGNPFHQNINKYIYITFSFSDIKDWYFNCGFYFNVQILTTPFDNKSSIIYKDSLRLDKKYYNSVYILEQIKDPYKVENLKYLYYTIKEGVVGFKTKDGHLWYLKN